MKSSIGKEKQTLLPINERAMPFNKVWLGSTMNSEMLIQDFKPSGPLLLKTGKEEPNGVEVDLYGWPENEGTRKDSKIGHPHALVVRTPGILKLNGRDRPTGPGDIFIIPHTKNPSDRPVFDPLVLAAVVLILATAMRFFLLLG